MIGLGAGGGVMVAALFVDPRGVYSGLPNVELWDESRDARLYDGPHPVVAHPPCARWCRLAWIVEACWGHKRGEDDGCFEAALRAVRTWGGVLEHPAYSDAWPAFGLNRPPTGGGWVNADFEGGWTCYVEQWRYGHPARKATWLYAHGVELPELRWGHLRDVGNETKREFASICQTETKRRRLRAKEISATPTEFRDELVALATGPTAYVRGGRSGKTEMKKSERSRTPEAFRDVLIDTAETGGRDG